MICEVLTNRFAVYKTLGDLYRNFPMFDFNY